MIRTFGVSLGLALGENRSGQWAGQGVLRIFCGILMHCYIIGAYFVLHYCAFLSVITLSLNLELRYIIGRCYINIGRNRRALKGRVG